MLSVLCTGIRLFEVSYQRSLKARFSQKFWSHKYLLSNLSVISN